MCSSLLKIFRLRVPHRKLRDFPSLTVDSKRCNCPSSRHTSGVHIPLMPINVAMEMRDLLIFYDNTHYYGFSFFLSFDLTSVFHYINGSALFPFCFCFSDFAGNFNYVSISHAVAWSDMIFSYSLSCICGLLFHLSCFMFLYCLFNWVSSYFTRTLTINKYYYY